MLLNKSWLENGYLSAKEWSWPSHHSQNQLEINNKDLSLKSVTIKHWRKQESKHFDDSLSVNMDKIPTKEQES